MVRPQSVLKTGLLVVGAVLLILVLAMSLYDNLGLSGLIDLVWKLLVLLLLADISAKLGTRNESKAPGGQQ